MFRVPKPVVATLNDHKRMAHARIVEGGGECFRYGALLAIGPSVPPIDADAKVSSAIYLETSRPHLRQ